MKASYNAAATGWQRELAEAIRDPVQLLEALNLPDYYREPARLASQHFPLLVPRAFLRRISLGNPHDPLLKQVLPLGQELQDSPGFSLDAVGDQDHQTSPGLIQKYQGRVLLILSGQCAINCRYCFRRHFPYESAPASLDGWKEIVQKIVDDPTIEEVILSGGDPLVWSDDRLHRFLQMFVEATNIQRIRIHSRLPVVIPARVTESLMTMLSSLPWTVWFVVHVNHPQELDQSCSDALRMLVESGFSTLNQAVLLRGINDSVDVQEELNRRLINLGIQPYYLHQLDRVSGTSHFETDERKGLEIIDQLKEKLPGYAIPRYVREISDEPSKTEIMRTA